MNLVRPDVERMSGYVPGEQPQDSGWTKLNTNENPYPPSPNAAAAIQAALSRLHVYPDPVGSAFRKAAAELHGVEPDWILPANGSDENLTILVRTFVDPGETIAYPYPSYILYETLAEIQGARPIRLPLNPDWSWDVEGTAIARNRAKLLFVPNPNSPSGNLWSDETIINLIPEQGLLVLDEAYRDFADQPRDMSILRSDAGSRIVITRTFSKSYSLAGLRFGYAIARPELIAQMRKVKDSYNCDALALAGAEAALLDQSWMSSNAEKIRGERGRLARELSHLGFEVVESQANFIWCRHPSRRHREIYEQLKQRKVLVRLMKFPGAFGCTVDAPFDGLRITIGTTEQIDRFIAELGEVLSSLNHPTGG
jgi:histidinol-phosphate aminotransferase